MPAAKTKGLPGWLIVTAATLVFVGFHGAVLSFSVFLKPLSDEFGWSRAATAGGMSVVQLVFAFFGIVTGVLADRYGAKLIVAAGAIIGAAGYLLMSRATELWQLYVFFGLAGGISLACVWVPITTMISHRFDKQRVLALGVATTGITVGQMAMAPLAAFVMSIYTWREAYLVLAVVVTAFAIPAMFMLEHHKAAPPAPKAGRAAGGQRQWSAREALRTVPLWMLLVMGFAISAGYYFIIAHIVAFATDIIPGLVVQTATLVLIVMGLAGIVGKVAVSPLTTRIGNRNTLFVVLALQTGALLSFAWANSLVWLFAGAAVFGLGFGATSPVRTSLIPELFGLSSVGALIGIVNVAWALGGAAGPFMAGYIFDVTRSYQVAFVVGGALLATGLLSTYFLREPKPETPAHE